MKFINRKDRNGNYVLGNDEIIAMLKQLNKKYHITSTAFPSDFVWEISRDDKKLGYTECILARHTSDDAPIRDIEYSCDMNDFDIFSFQINPEQKSDMKKDFRKMMFAKFGDEYLTEYKKWVAAQRKQELKEQTEVINAKYNDDLKMLP